MLKIIKNTLISLSILALAFGICLFIQNVFLTETLIPAVFVLAVFLIAFFTEGYIYGIISALFSVLIFNFAFSLPFFKFDFTIPENIISTVIMIIVTRASLKTRLIKEKADRYGSCKETFRRRAVALQGRLTKQMSCLAVFF